MRTVLAIILAVLLTLGVALLTPTNEDSPAFNCHLHGNLVCGTSAPWHGFTYEGE
jgi:uncharacterized protein YxeA